MNRLTVEWSKDTEDQLAAIWVQYPADAVAITKAADLLDRVLAKDPLGNGQPLSENLRKINISPLTAYYSVDQATNIVQVDAIVYTP